MVAVVAKVLYGNMQGGFGLTEKKPPWNTRIPDEVDLVRNSGADLFFPTELHANPDKHYSGLPDGGAAYFLDKLQAKDPDWDAVTKYNGGNGCYWRPSKWELVSKAELYFDAKAKQDSKSRNLNDFALRHKATGFVFHTINTHLEYRSGAAPDNVRQQSMRQLLKYAEKIGFCVVVGDFNSSSTRKNYPRWLAKQAGWKGLRDRGSVVNGTRSTGTSSTRKNYWIDEIFTRADQTVANAKLVLTNGASDHNGWLYAEVGFLTDSAPTAPPPSTLPTLPLPLSAYSTDTRNPWDASVRLEDGTLADPLRFSSAILVENYNAPDSLSLVGRIDGVRPGMVAGYGVVLHDSQGVRRFSGQLTSIERRGDGTATLIYTGDLARLWYRICYPVPSAEFTTAAQTSDHDVVTGTVEDRILSLVARNLGPGAASDRIDPTLRLPTSAGRGPSATTEARFEILGQLVATLAESANLRVRALQAYDADGTPHVDFAITDAPDIADWAAFGTPEGGGPWMLDPGWRYKIDLPTVTTALSGAGGEGATRILTASSDDEAEDVWGVRVEGFVDQRDTTEAADIATGLADALEQGAGPREISVPVGRSYGLGTVIPVGATVTVTLDGEPVSDRLRQLTTTIARDGNGADVEVSAVIGTPDTGPAVPSQKQLAAALRRLRNLERS